MSGDDQIELCIATELSSNAQVIHLSGSQLCECAAEALELRRQMGIRIVELKETIDRLRTHGSPWRRERAQVVRYLDARMTPVDPREVAGAIERGDHWADCYRETPSRTATGLTGDPNPGYDLRVPNPEPNCPLTTGLRPCLCDLPRCPVCGYTRHEGRGVGLPRMRQVCDRERCGDVPSPRYPRFRVPACPGVTIGRCRRGYHRPRPRLWSRLPPRDGARGRAGIGGSTDADQPRQRQRPRQGGPLMAIVLRLPEPAYTIRDHAMQLDVHPWGASGGSWLVGEPAPGTFEYDIFVALHNRRYGPSETGERGIVSFDGLKQGEWKQFIEVIAEKDPDWFERNGIGSRVSKIDGIGRFEATKEATFDAQAWFRRDLIARRGLALNLLDGPGESTTESKPPKMPPTTPMPVPSSPSTANPADVPTLSSLDQRAEELRTWAGDLLSTSGNQLASILQGFLREPGWSLTTKPFLKVAVYMARRGDKRLEPGE